MLMLNALQTALRTLLHFSNDTKTKQVTILIIGCYRVGWLRRLRHTCLFVKALSDVTHPAAPIKVMTFLLYCVHTSTSPQTSLAFIPPSTHTHTQMEKANSN